MSFIEIKQKIDGSRSSYNCNLLKYEDDLVVLSHEWHRDKPYKDGVVEFPAGVITTYAFYWLKKNYLMYKLFCPELKLLGHRFDICQIVSYGNDEIIWKDLVLDFWVDLNGEIHTLDEDELYRAIATCSITPEELIIVHDTKKDILSNFQSIVDSVEF